MLDFKLRMDPEPMELDSSDLRTQQGTHFQSMLQAMIVEAEAGRLSLDFNSRGTKGQKIPNAVVRPVAPKKTRKRKGSKKAVIGEQRPLKAGE